MDLSKTFMGNIRKYRKLRGLSQEKLAELCGASYSHIKQIEEGYKSPSFAFISKIAESLSVPPALLFTDESAEQTYRIFNSRQIEAELIDNLTGNVKAAFAKL
ncbi:MAG: helix-turn-helix transcriptional regulator [Spirochaetaceae bacterium]|jgi:transcriptional regulator with XRE-family HTH domain|nr:helix-turn-helix transcriptional regulator [Spirochaetaceae bacterium]